MKQSSGTVYVVLISSEASGFVRAALSSMKPLYQLMAGGAGQAGF